MNDYSSYRPWLPAVRRRNFTSRSPRRSRLTWEALESRLLLAADTLASIAGVVFDDVNDNGVFETDTDRAIQNTQVTLTLDGDPAFSRSALSDENGEYGFEELGEGTYNLTQAPIDGLFQRPEQRLQVVEISSEDAHGLSGPHLDAFDTFVAVSASPGMTPDFNFVKTPDMEALGGEREVAAQLTSSVGEINLRVNADGNSAMTLDSGSGAMGVRTVVWDGSDDNGNPGVDFGLNEDLTVDGTNAIVVNVSFDDIPMDLMVRVYGDSENFSEATIELPGLILDTVETFVVPYTEFTSIGLGADFSRVSAVELLADEAAPAIDLRIDRVGFLQPRLVSFANLQLGVEIQKSTNGSDADTPPGPSIGVGDVATFTYSATNSGNAALQITDVTDDNGTPNDSSDDFSPTPTTSDDFNVGDTNRNRLLDVDEAWSYSATRQVTEGAFSNRVVITAEDTGGAGELQASDVSNHFGTDPSISLEKQTNGQDADEAPGPLIAVGQPANFDYAVGNTGNVALDQLELIDDNGTPNDSSDDFAPPPREQDGFNIGDINRNNLVDLNEVWQFSASRVVTPGPYANIANVLAIDSASELTVRATDTSHHFGSDPAVQLTKQTNGQDANDAPGVQIPVGDTATFSYFVANRGNVLLDVTQIRDDNGTPDDTADDFTPASVLDDAGNHNIGDSNQNGSLDQTETWQYTANRVVTPGQYRNLATVSTQQPETGQVVNAEDASHHFGAATGIDIQTLTNNQDADVEPGPLLPVGDQVIWDYQVSNLGNVPLQLTLIQDDNGTPDDTNDDFAPAPVLDGEFNIGDTNRDGLIDLEEVWLYTANQVVTSGQYSNTGRVSAAEPQSEDVVTDSDPTHHFGVLTGVSLQKLTNGQDADVAPGPILPIGSTASFTYEVSNLGNAPLTSIELIDDNGTPDDSADDLIPTPEQTPDGFNVGDTNRNQRLDLEEIWQYRASRTVTAGPHANLGTVTAQETNTQQTVTDADPSNHFGAVTEVQLEKQTNGQDADIAPGPLLPVGSTASFTYLAENPGNVPLEVSSISDDNGTPSDPSDDFAPAAVQTPDGFNIGDSNQNRLLDVAETWQYRASKTVTIDQYTNVGTLAARSPDTDESVIATDASNHFGTQPQIELEKQTNGQDADEAPGPLIAVGQPANFDYAVGNTGNVALDQLELIDDNGTPNDSSDDFAPPPREQDGFNIGDINRNNLVDLNEVWQFSASRVVTPGPYANIANVLAIDSASELTVRATDTSHHFGSDPAVQLTKQTNGQDANDAPGVQIPVGDTATFSYFVANRGNVLLDVTQIRDDNGTPDDTADDFTPASVLDDAGNHNIGDSNQNGSLDQTETWQYTANRVVTPGQYRNLATVSTQQPETGQVVNAEDASHHFGAATGIDIQTLTNNQDADVEPGPLLPVGDQVIWDYQVSNLGNVPLQLTLIQDDNGTPDDTNDDFAPAPVLDGEFNIGDTNRDGLIDLEEVWLYTANQVVTSGQYSNTGRVSAAEPQSEDVVTDSDPTHHFGVLTGVSLQKLTNGQDADVAPGPILPIGSTASFTYEVSNLGNAPLTSIELIDDNGTPDDSADDLIPTPEQTPDGFNVGDTNRNQRLDLEEIWQYRASRTVTAGPHANLGTVTAQETNTQQTVTDADPSNHFGAVTEVQLEKQTNGQDADIAPGPLLPVGSTASFTYLAENPGNVPLEVSSISDDNGTPSDPSDDFAPAAVQTPDGFNIGDSNQNRLLDVAETWQYRASRTVTIDQYTNVGTLAARSPDTDESVIATDASNHFGTQPQIELEKQTNGQDADEAPGPLIAVGQPANFDYAVGNTGNVALDQLELIDDNGTPNDSSDDFAPPPREQDGFNIGDINRNNLVDLNEVWQFSASRVVTPGPYANVAEARGHALDQTTSAQDISHHFGAAPQVQLTKLTNGQDADTSPGPILPVGSTASFAYEVGNLGNVPLASIELIDDNGTPDDSADDLIPTPEQTPDGFNVGDTNRNQRLDLEEIWQYRASRTVTAGPHANLGTVTAQETNTQQTVTDADPSNHFGAVTEVQLEKQTNGQDADIAPGPLLPVGSTASFTYLAENPGNVPLEVSSISDDNGTPSDPSDDFAPAAVQTPDGFNIGDSNQNRLLDVAETWQYRASKTVTIDQYTNVGTLAARSPDTDESVIATDASNHFGTQPQIELEKQTNGQDADEAPGPLIAVGQPANFDYAVRNTGNVALDQLELIDDNGTPNDSSDDFAPPPREQDGFNIGDINRNNLVDLNEVWQFSASRVVTPGPYANVAEARGHALDQTTSAQDISHHFGAAPQVQIETLTNGQDADTPTGPAIAEGDFANFSYWLSNSGNVPLQISVVVDDNGTPDDSTDDFAPIAVLQDGFNVGDTNRDHRLDLSENWQYEASRVVELGQFRNVGSVIATEPSTQQSVSDEDASHHFGRKPPGIFGIVFNDWNEDGIVDPEDRPVEGVQIVLSRLDAEMGEIVVKTGVDGTYAFTNLDSGRYKITEIQPIRYFDGEHDGVMRTDNRGTVINDPQRDMITDIVFAADETLENFNFSEIGISKRRLFASTPRSGNR